jgi:hypothetical protein
VPQLDAFVLPESAVLTSTEEVPASEFVEPADDEPADDEPAHEDAQFDPGVFRPSRALLELRELLAANGALESAPLPDPREPADFGDLRSLTADPRDLSGLRPWLESFQQRLGPPTTGETPTVGDRA